MARDGGGAAATGDDAGGFDAVAFLLGSANRVDALRVLTQSPVGRRELQSAVDASRPTIARVLKGFEERGWVERDGGTYRTTPAGDLLATAVFEAIETAESVDRFGWLYGSLPDPVEPPDPAVLEDATVTRAAPATPFGPVDRFAELLAGSATLRECGPVSIGRTAAARCRTTPDAVSGEVVYPSGVVAALLADDDGIAAAVGEGRIRVHVHDPPPFGVALLDDRLVVVRYDAATATPRALLEAATPAATAWGVATFERYRDAAVPLAEHEGHTSEGSGTPSPVDDGSPAG